jgi:hypothetical protein
MAVPDKFRIYLEIIKGLNGCLTIGKNTDVPTCVALFYTLHYTCLRGIYFSLEYSDLETKAEAILPSWAPSINSRAITLTGLGPVHVPDQVPFNIWCEHILPFTLVRKLDCEWLVVCISQYHPVSHL